MSFYHRKKINNEGSTIRSKSFRYDKVFHSLIDSKIWFFYLDWHINMDIEKI